MFFFFQIFSFPERHPRTLSPPRALNARACGLFSGLKCIPREILRIAEALFCLRRAASKHLGHCCGIAVCSSLFFPPHRPRSLPPPPPSPRESPSPFTNSATTRPTKSSSSSMRRSSSRRRARIASTSSPASGTRLVSAPKSSLCFARFSCFSCLFDGNVRCDIGL